MGSLAHRMLDCYAKVKYVSKVFRWNQNIEQNNVEERSKLQND